MKIKHAVAVLFFAICLVSTFASKGAFADNLGNGSTDTDCLQVGTITKLGDREFDLTTEFEKTAKPYHFKLHQDAYVHTADRGVFKKFKELKVGDLVASYGWKKDGVLVSRRISILDRNDYLVKRLTEDAKAGVYYKHER